MAREKKGQAKKDARRDMRKEGLISDCPHSDTDTTYSYDGKGNEHCVKFCNQCGKTIRRWTN